MTHIQGNEEMVASTIKYEEKLLHRLGDCAAHLASPVDSHTELRDDLRKLLTTKDQACREAERERIIASLKNIPDGADIKVSGYKMNESGVGGWNQLRYALIQNFETLTSPITLPTKETL